MSESLNKTITFRGKEYKVLLEMLNDKVSYYKVESVDRKYVFQGSGAAFFSREPHDKDYLIGDLKKLMEYAEENHYFDAIYTHSDQINAFEEWDGVIK